MGKRGAVRTPVPMSAAVRSVRRRNPLMGGTRGSLWRLSRRSTHMKVAAEVGQLGEHREIVLLELIE